MRTSSGTAYLERDNSADVIHNIPASGIGKVEGEDYVDASSGVRYEDFQDDGQGQPGRCLSNMRAGSRANYKLNVEETGTYRMVVHYAAVGETALNTTATFLINNITQPRRGDLLQEHGHLWKHLLQLVDLEP
mgnify:CR=1 FL=1